jgi:protein involved in polysaccharide export with SLBB domain
MEDAVAATPSAQQMEQFKKLPKAQQEALAKKYGFNLKDLQEKQGDDKKSALPESTIEPRTKEEIEADELEKKFKPKEEELKPFGYELFEGEPTTFIPTEMAAIPDTYLIGVGDEVKINLYGKTSDEYEVQVDREGRLAIPNLSPVHVIGLSFKELKELIKSKISDEMIGVRAFVSMGQLNAMRIMVVGEAYKPGSYTVSPLATVTHALFVAGGVNELGSLRKIQVKRAGKEITTFDLYDLLLFGDSSKDVSLKPGDVVFIPPATKKIKIKGEVTRKAIFELVEKDDAKSIIAMSGGFKASANKSKVVVSRFNGSGSRVTLNVNFNDETQYKPLNGDEIVVNTASQRMKNTITLIGAVTSPGNYEWHEGKTIRDVFTIPRDDILPIADFSYALIIRETNLEGDIEVLQFSPENVLVNNQSNLALKSNDTIIVFSRYDLKKDEEATLKSLAFNQEQLKLKENIALWEQYEREEFLKFIGVKEDDEFDFSSEEDEEVISSINALFEEEDEVEEEEYAVFSRYNLLKPIIAKLQKQATASEPAKLFALNGRVKFPGVYPLPNKANFAMAVAAGGGFLESAYLEKVELTRVHTNDLKQVQHVQFNARDELGLVNQVLQSKDTINIFPKPNWQERLEVEVVGEVMFPGTYTIQRGETLESLVKRAGGFSEFAHKEAAIFTRESIKRKEKSQIQRLTQELRRDIVTNSFQRENKAASAELPYEDLDQILKDLSKIEAVGRLVIDLDSPSSQGLQLEGNDALYIPAKQDSVSVIGEVNLASTHIYDSNKDVSEYIKASGGFKQKADEGRIYIIKANGSVELPNDSGSWFAVNQSGSQLSPGDTIVVPLDSQHLDSLTLWSTATQIIYQLGLAAASIATLNN